MNDTKNTNFSIRLDGDLNGVDINTFIDMLGNLSVVIHEINDELNTNKALKINIQEVKTGSYDIFLMLKESLLDAISQYMNKENLAFGGIIISSLAGLLAIRKHLGGESAKNVKTDKGETTITNKDGTVLNIDNRIYNIFSENQIIDAATSKTFDAINEDKAIKTFEIYDENRNRLFESEQENFKALSSPAVLPESDTKKGIEESVLTIFKVVFEKGYKWTFIYRGIKISASITDETFYKRIDEGVKFSKGDTLIADLEIVKVFDETINAYVNKDYIVKKVNQHVPRCEQRKLFSEQ